MGDVTEVQLAAIEERGDELDAVVISDYSDCDGRGAGGVYTRRFGGDMVLVPASHRGGAPDFDTALEGVADSVAPGVPVYVSDLSPNEDESEAYTDAFGALAARNPVRVRDHHEWPDDTRAAVEAVADDVTIDHDRCATEIVADEDFEGESAEEREMIDRLAETTRVRDLWEDDREEFDGDGQNLVDASFDLDYMEYERLVSRVGTDVMSDEQLGDRLRERRSEKRARIDLVAETARRERIGEYDVAFAYGDCYSSGAGSELQDRGADLAVIVTPGGKVSLRSDDDSPIAESVASDLGGGGHPCAAGCKPVEIGSEGDIGYRDLWATRGLGVHMTVADAIHRLDAEGELGDGDGDGDDGDDDDGDDGDEE